VNGSLQCIARIPAILRRFAALSSDKQKPEGPIIRDRLDRSAKRSDFRPKTRARLEGTDEI